MLGEGDRESLTTYFPGFTKVKLETVLSVGDERNCHVGFPSVLIFLSINGINTFNFSKTLKSRISFCHMSSNKISNRRD